MKGKQVEVKALHYPLFCSDWQPLFAVLSLLGLNMTIEDTLFESRFGYLLDKYKKFNVKSRMINDRQAIFLDSEGFENDPQKKIVANAVDLRCGAGLGLLSMLHEGEAEIHNVIQIKRGYENFDKQLNTLIGSDLYSYQR